MKKLIFALILYLSISSVFAQKFDFTRYVYKLNGAIYNEKNVTNNSSILVSNQKIVITTIAHDDTIQNSTKVKEWKLLELNEISNSKNGELDFGEEIIVIDSDKEKWKGYLYKRGDKNYFILSNFYIPSEIWYELIL